jgi:hypothetical protein
MLSIYKTVGVGRKMQLFWMSKRTLMTLMLEAAASGEGLGYEQHPLNLS